MTENNLTDFLLNPENYPEKPVKITHYETHISHIFMGERFVYKLKKPVDYGFLNFTTLKKRHYYCEREVALNSRLAKGIYIGTVPVYKSKSGLSFQRTSGGKIADYMVKMKRIPENKILFNLINHGEVLRDEMSRVAKKIADFHNSSPVYKGGGYDGLKAVIFNTEEDFEQIKPFVGKTITGTFYKQLKEYTREYILKNKPLFSERKSKGFVREIHGDLHSQHICLSRPPVIFDCIEFNRRFGISDILDDIAFLLMDLEFEGRFDLSGSFSRKYFSQQKAALNKELLRFYMIYRATVRGKVEGFIAKGVKDAAEKKKAVKMAKDYFELARYYIEDFDTPFNPVVFMGVSGSGKSTIAGGLGKDKVVLRSDEIRKKITGVKKTEHSYVKFGKGIYTPDCTKKTYDEMMAEAVKISKTGRKVIVDATFLKASQRRCFLANCLKAGLNPFFINCFASWDTLKDRVRERIRKGRDVSDANVDILKKQLKELEPPDEMPSFRLFRLNTENKTDAMIAALKGFLK